MRPATDGRHAGGQRCSFSTCPPACRRWMRRASAAWNDAKQQALQTCCDGHARRGRGHGACAPGQTFDQPLVSRSTDHAQAAPGHSKRCKRATAAARHGRRAVAGHERMRREIDSAWSMYVFTDDARAFAFRTRTLRAVGEPARQTARLIDMSDAAGEQPRRSRAWSIAAWRARSRLECYADGALCDVRAVSAGRRRRAGRALLTVPEDTRCDRGRRASPGRATLWRRTIRPLGRAADAGGSVQRCW